MDAERYLSRIGWTGGVPRPDVATLAALVRAHRFSVPYETLDLWRRRPFSLGLDEMFDKLVVRRRGGYCFELNGLFAELLRAVGYNVREYFGRWLLGEDESVPMRRHRVVCVALSGGPNRIVDVGIGLPFMFSPLSFVFDVPQALDGKVYRVVRDPVLVCVVQVRAHDGWKNLFSFDTAPQLPIDFEYANWWCRTNPGSSFLSKVWVYLPQKEGGARAISFEKDDETGANALFFAVVDGSGRIEKRRLAGDEDLRTVLKDRFGIVENPADDCNLYQSTP